MDVCARHEVERSSGWSSFARIEFREEEGRVKQPPMVGFLSNIVI